MPGLEPVLMPGLERLAVLLQLRGLKLVLDIFTIIVYYTCRTCAGLVTSPAGWRERMRKVQIVSTTIPTELLEAVDRCANALFMNRSQFVTQALRQYVQDCADKIMEGLQYDAENASQD